MSFPRIAATASLLTLVTLAAGQAAPKKTLEVGDAAPRLKPSQWLKGTPIPKFEKGKVYVVEFWATWCGPCKAAMPHLSKLAKDYRGKVEFVGVDAFEPKELGKVRQFVQQQGSLMNYTVAADAAGDTTWADWLTAAGESGIPTAFVVGKQGRIEFIGRPQGLVAILPLSVSGKVDLGAQKQAHEASRDPHAALDIAFGAGDYLRVIELVDAHRKQNPSDPQFGTLELYRALAHLDSEEFGRRFRADVARTDDMGLYNFATLALLSSGLSKEHYRLGAEIAQEAAGKFEARLMFLARGAQLAFWGGASAKAVEMQTDAIQIAESTTGFSEDRKAELRKDLETYRGKQ